MNLAWSPAFSRSVKKMLRQSPQMAKPIAKALGQLSADAYHPSCVGWAVPTDHFKFSNINILVH